MKKKNQRLASLNITKVNFFTGVFLGLTNAFIFYSFLYLLREALRLLSITEEYDLWILSNEEVGFYNLFFALLSVIFGQSICFVFLTSKSKQVFQKSQIKRQRIIHDQRFLNWFFLSWSSKLILVFALIFGHVFVGGFYSFSFYPNYKYLFVLIVVVLFLQTWNSIRINFGRKSLKFLLISASFIFCISYLMSKIDLIDYENLNKSILRNKIENKYNLVIPESDSYVKLEHKYLINRFYFVENKRTKRPIILKDKKEIPFSEVSREVGVFNSYISETEVPFVTYQLHIHKDIQMKFINPLIKEFSLFGTRIGFAVTPKGEINKYDNINISLLKSYGQYNKEFNYKVQQTALKKFKNKILIEQNEDGSSNVNKVLIKDDSEIIRIVKKEIRENSENYIIMLSIDGNATFSSYIKILSLFRIAALEVRNEYSLSKYLTKFESLNREQRVEVYNKFPIRVFESFKISN